MNAERGRTERGNVTVLTAVAVVAAIVLSLALARIGGATGAKARANTAADAAALAAADVLALGRSPEDARFAANRTARDNGAQLLTCRCGGWVAVVTVRVDAARAIARAEVTPVAPSPRSGG